MIVDSLIKIEIKIKIYFSDYWYYYMKDKLVSYQDILDGQDDIPEMVDRGRIKPNPYIIQYLVNILQIADEKNAQQNFDEMKNNKIDKLYSNMKESYEKSNILKGNKINSKNAQENIQRKKEIKLMKEKDKMEILVYIKNGELIVDTMKFIYADDDDQEQIITWLWVIIWDIGTWFEGEEDSVIYAIPEFVLDSRWWYIKPDDSDHSWEIELDKIQEIIVDETRYLFL